MALIPAGSFEMGDHFAEGEADELPVHRVELDAFYMDRFEVTIGRYKQFLRETGHGTLPVQTPSWVAERAVVQAKKGGQQVVGFTRPTDNHPVAGVTWNDAHAYAEWAGKRLPTEAEWEYAARGGLRVEKRYVWGNQAPEETDGNFAGLDPKQQADDGYLYTAPVHSYRPNGYRLYDMAGNVWEWCADWYGENYYGSSAALNPKGPETGEERVLRGGGWSSYPQNLRLARRFKLSPTATGFDRKVESSDLEEPDLGQKPKPDAGQKPDPGQKPNPNPGQEPDLPKPDPGQKPKPDVDDDTVWVGFRCVAELNTDD